MEEVDDQTPLLQKTSCFGDNLEDISCSGEKHALYVQGRSKDESNGLVSIFVVAFDIRVGNIVEWALPNDCNLSGIEFKAMASGSHRVQTDFIYFKWDQLYGLACFENMSVDIVEERGAQMKSVGILSATYTSLHQHKPFLKKQVRYILEHPRCYDELVSYYEREKGVLPANNDYTNLSYSGNTVFGLSIPVMDITHPSGCFSQFINCFGEKIFSLWRVALLKKRLLFFSSPPIGVACYRGTTEKIFESKTHLYDLYIDNQDLRASNSRLKKLLITNNADKAKYRDLCKLKSWCLSSIHNTDMDSIQETWFIRYFLSLNNLLFGTLSKVSKTPDRQWTKNHMKAVGLDPFADYQFVSELIELYGINVSMYMNNPCCPSLESCCHF